MSILENQPVSVAKIRVRYGETDQMGHAYYGNYMLWFEEARGVWFRDHGLSYKEVEERGWRLPVVELWTKYRGEIKYDDIIEIRVWIAELRRASVKIQYEVFNSESGKVTTEGYTWHVLVGENMKAISWPQELKDLILQNGS